MAESTGEALLGAEGKRFLGKDDLNEASLAALAEETCRFAVEEDSTGILCVQAEAPTVEWHGVPAYLLWHRKRAVECEHDGLYAPPRREHRYTSVPLLHLLNRTICRLLLRKTTEAAAPPRQRLRRCRLLR